MGLDIFDVVGLDIFGGTLASAEAIDVLASGDLDDYFQFSVTSDRPLFTAIGNYLVLGKDATTGHSLDADDVLFGEDIEVDGMAWLDGGLTLGGAVACSDQAFTGVGDMTFTDGSILQTGTAVDDLFQIKAYKTDATAARVTLLEFINDATLPFFTVGAETAYKLKFDPAVAGIYFGDSSDSWDILLRLEDTNILTLRNSADSGDRSLRLKAAYIQEDIFFTKDGGLLQGPGTNAYSTIITAKITDGAQAEVARFIGAADPYFSMGGSQEHKFYNSGIAELGAEVGFGAAGSLTIATGAIAVTKVYHTIVVENGTGSGADQLDTATGGAEGRILIIKPATSGANDQVTVADGTGANTFILAGDANFVMDHIDDRLMCIHNGTEWVEISRSSNS